jgi:hypothetical protein
MWNLPGVVEPTGVFHRLVRVHAFMGEQEQVAQLVRHRRPTLRSRTIRSCVRIIRYPGITPSDNTGIQAQDVILIKEKLNPQD